MTIEAGIPRGHVIAATMAAWGTLYFLMLQYGLRLIVRCNFRTRKGRLCTYFKDRPLSTGPCHYHGRFSRFRPGRQGA